MLIKVKYLGEKKRLQRILRIQIHISALKYIYLTYILMDILCVCVCLFINC